MPLEQLAQVRLGFAPRRLLPDPGGPYLGLSGRDLASGDIPWSQLLRPRVESDASRYEVRDGDLVVSLRGAGVRAWRMEPPPAPTIAVGQLAIVSPHRDLVDADYLAWFLNHAAIARRFDGLARGTRQPFVTMSAFRRFEVVLPDLRVQRLLGRAGQLGETERTLTGQLAELRRTALDSQLLRVAETR